MISVRKTLWIGRGIRCSRSKRTIKNSSALGAGATASYDSNGALNGREEDRWDEISANFQISPSLGTPEFQLPSNSMTVTPPPPYAISGRIVRYAHINCSSLQHPRQ